jgi:hypothetical protein
MHRLLDSQEQRDVPRQSKLRIATVRVSLRTRLIELRGSFLKDISAKATTLSSGTELLGRVPGSVMGPGTAINVRVHYVENSVFELQHPNNCDVQQNSPSPNYNSITTSE